MPQKSHPEAWNMLASRQNREKERKGNERVARMISTLAGRGPGHLCGNQCNELIGLEATKTGPPCQWAEALATSKVTPYDRRDMADNMINHLDSLWYKALVLHSHNTSLPWCAPGEV